MAWFTGAEGRPRVLAAFSRDGGASFDTPTVIDDQRPLGRVDIALEGAGVAVVSWIATSAAGSEIRLQRVAPGGLRGEPCVVTATTPRRSAGVPTLLRVGERLIVAWVEDAQPARVRAAAIAIGDL